MVELRGRRGHAIAMVVARVPAASRRRVWRRREDTLERQTSARVRGEAAEADVVEQDVLGVDERVRIRRGVRGGQVAGSHRRHTSDGSIEPLPELEHLPLRLEREADLAPGVHLARTARDLEHGPILPQRSPDTHPDALAVNVGDRVGTIQRTGALDTISHPPASLDGEARPRAHAWAECRHRQPSQPSEARRPKTRAGSRSPADMFTVIHVRDAATSPCCVS